jgi:hypothetical protein
MLNPNLASTLAKARQRELIEEARRANPERRRDRITGQRPDERRPRARFAVLRMAGEAGKDSACA